MRVEDFHEILPHLHLSFFFSSLTCTPVIRAAERNSFTNRQLCESKEQQIKTQARLVLKGLLWIKHRWSDRWVSPLVRLMPPADRRVCLALDKFIHCFRICLDVRSARKNIKKFCGTYAISDIHFLNSQLNMEKAISVITWILDEIQSLY